MFSASQQNRRRAFFSLWKECIHPIADIPADIKGLLYPKMRDCIVMRKDELFSSSVPDWVARGIKEVKLRIEQNIQKTDWRFDNTQVHVFMVDQIVLFLWVDIPNSSDIDEIIDILNFQLAQKTDERLRSKWELVLQFGVQKLQKKDTYIVALVVGSLITVYGQFIVPYLRNEVDVWGIFTSKMLAQPNLSLFSILLAYLFPIGVQLHATIVTRLREIQTQAQIPRR
ncbi:MAG: hypothetical protein CL916_06640 [Deltaproteobacteria bacterium]|nr:hypothetical protein [Deltaproteobacteria bacterium]